MRQISARSWCSKGKKPLKKFKTFPINRAIIPSRTFHDDDDDANATPQKRDHDDRPSSLFDDGGARPLHLSHFYALFISLLRAELLHRRCANARATRRGKETRFASASSSSVVWKRKRAGRKTTAQTTATGRRCSTGGATAASSAAATGAAARRTETTSPEQHERRGFSSNPKQ